jgi:hypothetical protein
MSADVLEIASRDTVDAAWNAYQRHAERAFDDRRLLLDRGYMEEWARLEAKFKRLSLMPRAY